MCIIFFTLYPIPAYTYEGKGVFIVNNEKGTDIIKKLIDNMEASSTGFSHLGEEDIRRSIKSVDRSEVIRRLNSMGLGNVAQMIGNMSDEEIIRKISANPSILKKLNGFMKGGK